jgi:colanic acid/amylovoran biosynthesis protein
MLIAIENTVCLNAGDAAILLALMRELRSAFGEATRFVVFDADPEASARYFPGIEFRPQVSSLLTVPRLPARIFGRSWAIRLRRNAERLLRAEFARVVRAAGRGREVQSLLLGAALKENIEIYRQADLVVSTGGTYLVEHYDLEAKLIEFEKDMALRKPLVLFTQSMGPFDNPRNRKRLGKVLDYAALTLLREERSQGHALGIAREANTAIAADSVFALAEPATMEQAAKRRPAPPRQVAVSVREWAHFSRTSAADGMGAYEQAIAAAVIALVEQHAVEVTFVSTCQGVAEYRFDDSIVANRIVERLPEAIRPSVAVDERFHTPEALMQQLGSFDFVISTRMHMAILALCAGVPVLPIAYEFKTTELFASLGQARWVTDIDGIEADAFGQTVLQFAASLGDYSAAAFPKVSELSASARSAGAKIRAAVEGQMAVTG